ncbi:hypothetical protein OEZ86_000408 [Tetradesmus obliquus]|nr:hypothetical protein OEZ86_000408 [Tetradesmus obliquus]
MELDKDTFCQPAAVAASIERDAAPTLWHAFRAFYLRNHLLVGFCASSVVALAWPLPGRVLYAPAVAGVHVLPFVAVALVFFISGLTLKTDELRTAFTRRAAAGTLFGLVSILGITPLLGFGLRLLPLQPVELVVGLVVVAVMPTSLGVGIALAAMGKGNVGLAIFLTVASNILGIALVPLWLSGMLNTPGSPIHSSSSSSSTNGSAAAGQLQSSIHINLADMFVKLLLSNLAPTLLGKLLRERSAAVRSWVGRSGTLLAVLGSSCLSLISWLSLSSARDPVVRTEFGAMLLVLAISGLQHAAYLAFNAGCVWLLRLQPPEAVSTVLLASMKAPPVAFTVITYMTPDPVLQGLLAVPSIAGGLLSVFIDQPLANYYAAQVTQWQQDHLPRADMTAEVSSSSDADSKSGRGTNV